MIEEFSALLGSYIRADLQSLGNDILGRILQFLCAKSLARLSCANTYFRDIIEDEALWQRHVDMDWRSWSTELAQQRQSGRYRELYAFRAMLDSAAKRKLSQAVWPLERKEAEKWFVAHNVNVMVRLPPPNWRT